MLGKEYHAVVRPTQKPAQRKHSVDHQVLPLRPVLSHRCSSRLRTRNRRFALPRLYDDITQREADGLSIWSNCDGSHGIHHTRAGWLYLLADRLQNKPLPSTDITRYSNSDPDSNGDLDASPHPREGTGIF